MKDNDLKATRDRLIYKAYCTAWGEGMRDDAIFKNLREVHFLTVKTLTDIVRAMRKKSQD